MSNMETHYESGLILISVLISIAASYAALSLADRMRAARFGWTRRFWLLGGSAAMGGGVWSMHYLGMLAVQLPVKVYYFWPVVVLSLLMAIAASAVALLVVSRDALSWRRLMAGAVLMGAGIGAMHYTGMSAMRTAAMHHYSGGRVALSLGAAVLFSWAALWIAFAVRDREGRRTGQLRLAGGTVMGVGIASMHYIAMSAVHFAPGGAAFSTAHSVNVSVLGEAGIACTTGLILLAALLTASMDKRRFNDLRRAHARLERAQAALLESEQKLREMNVMLSELSIRDGLTGLYNRRRFDEALDAEHGRASRKMRPISVLMIDVDHFKALNDRYGHQRGDDCLRAIARVLDDGPRRGYDLVARYGGEEFVVLLPEAEMRDALKIAETIRVAVRDLEWPNAGAPGDGFVSVSIGVCCERPFFGQSPEDLVRMADAALYKAKRTGRGRVELAMSEMVDAVA